MMRRIVPLAAVLLLALSGTAARADQATETAALQHEGLSASQASCDVAAQVRAGNIAEELEDALGARYGGIWFDQQSCQFKILIPPNTDTVPVTELIVGRSLEESAELVPVAYTWAQVEQRAKALRRQLRGVVPPGQADVLTMPQTDSVLVKLAAGIAPSAVAPRLVPTLAIPFAVPVRIESTVSPTLAVPAGVVECKFPFCDPPLRGGTEVHSSPDCASGQCWSSICSSGFLVRQNSRTNPNVPWHEKYLTTDAHCFYGSLEHDPEKIYLHQAWLTNNAAQTQTYEFKPGPDGSLPNLINVKADIGLLPLGGNQAAGEVAEWEQKIADYKIGTKVLTTYVGLVECHSGRSSGEHCGTVVAHNVTTTIDYSEEGFGELEEQHMDRVCAGSAKGDSGGPFYTNHQGTGMLVGVGGIDCAEESIANELHWSLAQGPEWKLTLQEK